MHRQGGEFVHCHDSELDTKDLREIQADYQLQDHRQKEDDLKNTALNDLAVDESYAEVSPKEQAIREQGKLGDVGRHVLASRHVCVVPVIQGLDGSLVLEAQVLDKKAHDNHGHQREVVQPTPIRLQILAVHVLRVDS